MPFARLVLPFVLILTPATAILGFLLLDTERRIETERSLAISEERIRAIADKVGDHSKAMTAMKWIGTDEGKSAILAKRQVYEATLPIITKEMLVS